MSNRAFCCTNIYRFQMCLIRCCSPRDTQLPFETWFITTIYTYLLKEVVYHGKNSIVKEKKLKSLYILSQKYPDRHKHIDKWYLLNKYGPDNQNFNVFFTSWMKKINKNVKVDKFTIMLGIAVRLIVIPYIGNFSRGFNFRWIRVLPEIVKIRHSEK